MGDIGSAAVPFYRFGAHCAFTICHFYHIGAATGFAVLPFLPLYLPHRNYHFKRLRRILGPLVYHLAAVRPYRAPIFHFRSLPVSHLLPSTDLSPLPPLLFSSV